MKGLTYIPLRVRTPYSLAEGAMKLPDIIKRSRGFAVPAVGITDHNNLFGALETSQALAKEGIQPIIGMRLMLTYGEDATPRPLYLYARNAQGYQNLMALSSRAYLDTEPSHTPHVPLTLVQEHSEGLLAVTGDADSHLGHALQTRQSNQADIIAQTWHEIFGDNLYFSLCRDEGAPEIGYENALRHLAHRLTISMLAINEAYYAEPAMHRAHDALLCIRQQTTLSDPHRQKSLKGWYYASPEQMQQRFADVPVALANTISFAQRVTFMPSTHAPILPPFTQDGLSDETAILKKMAEQGLAERGVNDDAYQQRLAYELDVIINMGFAGYFLIVADFIQWAKKQGIPVGPGRGSGAGSVVAWALKITDLDPLRYNLLFERFLNPERVSMPDFDIDFCQDRRDEVIAYVQKRYGRDRVAQIITFGKLQARAVLRDVGRVLEMPYGQVDRLCKLVPNNPANPVTLQQAIDSEAALQELQKNEEEGALINIGLQLEGLYRHASTHAAGIVIGDRPLQELIPLYRDPRSTMPVTQFNMKYAESAGLVKFDFLGLKTLTVMQEACALIKASTGQIIDLLNLPMDDAKTYAMLSKGEASGVFQLESAGMRDVLRKMQPDRFEDIIALVALYRPGPMDNIPRYIAVKHGLEKPDYLHPSLQPILQETFGVMIYQEQVMQIAQVLAGYSLGSADLLRRAMGKKIKAEMDAQREAFVKGALANNIAEATASSIFDQVAKFAGYGFNKSHAAAYALIAYQTAWLKANYPVEFFAALMTHDRQNTDKLALFRQELQRLAITLLPPDINASYAYFSVEQTSTGKAIRYALAALKGVGEGAIQRLTDERDARGPFTSLHDMVQRLDSKVVNKRLFESLAQAGAFDSLHPNRASVFAMVDLLTRLCSHHHEQKQQNTLFGNVSIPEAEPPAIADWPPMERLFQEREAVGFYLSAHPLDSYAPLLDKLRVVRFAELGDALRTRPSTRVTLAGIIVSKKERRSAKGNKFAFVTFSDSTGSFEVTLFSEILAASRTLLEKTQPLLISVDVQQEGESFRLTAQNIKALEEQAMTISQGICLTLDSELALPKIRDILAQDEKGMAKVRLRLQLDNDTNVDIDLPHRYSLPPTIRHKITNIADIKSFVDL